MQTNLRRHCILLVGPESSATRWVAGTLSQHPDILGPSGSHPDPLDNYWAQQAEALFQANANDSTYVLTRRSLPSGNDLNKPARYLEFDDFEAFGKACESSNTHLTVLVLTRSPEANIYSWHQSRASAAGSKSKAVAQYRAAYKHLMSWLIQENAPEFWFISLESLLLEGSIFVNSIYRLLDLPSYDVSITSNYAVNFKQYSTAEDSSNFEFSLDELIETIQNAKGLQLLAGGWATPETRHTWSIGDRCHLKMHLKVPSIVRESARNLLMKLDLHPYIFGEHSNQQITIIINNSVTSVHNIGRDTLLQVNFPLDLLGGDGELNVIIVTPNSISPIDIDKNSKESKKIAIALRSLMISACQPDSDGAVNSREP